MTKQGADVRDIHTLGNLHNALGRFASNTREAMLAAERDIRRTQEWLHGRERYWQHIEREIGDDFECVVPATRKELQHLQEVIAQARRSVP